MPGWWLAASECADIFDTRADRCCQRFPRVQAVHLWRQGGGRSGWRSVAVEGVEVLGAGFIVCSLLWLVIQEDPRLVPASFW